MSFKKTRRLICSALLLLTGVGFSLMTTNGLNAQGVAPEGSQAIWWMFEKLGRDKGPLGKGATDSGGRADIKPTTGKRGAYWTFQNGMITWSPHAGQSCVLAAYWNPDKKNPNSIIVRWGPTDPFDYDLFIVRMESPGVKARQSDVMTRNSKLATRSSGALLIPNADRGRTWTILVEGADRGSTLFGGTSTVARQGWMHPVTVGGPPPAPASKPAAPQTPTISVNVRLKNAPVSLFTIAGNGFTANKQVVVLATNDEMYQVNFTTNASAAGKIQMAVEIPHQPGWRLNFVALDTRKNPSNLVTVICPDYDAGQLSTQSGKITPAGANNSKTIKPSVVTKSDAIRVAQLRSELVIAQFSGVIQGSNYVLNGTVKHAGKSRLLAGGDIHLYAVNSKGKAKLVKTVVVPALALNKSWTLPPISVPAAKAGSAPADQFILIVGKANSKSKNVWKPLRVTRRVPTISEPLRLNPAHRLAPILRPVDATSLRLPIVPITKSKK